MNIFHPLAAGLAILIALPGAIALAQDSGTVEATAAEAGANPAGTADVSTGTDGASIDAQFAAGRHEGGKILANIGRRFVMGNNLMLDVVFKPTSDGMQVDPEGKVALTRIYNGVSRSTYEQIYLIAGDKKYMAVKDDDGKVSVTQNVNVEGEGAIVGQWNGIFPAPPADTPVMLYLPGFSAIGPFSVPSN